MPPLMAGAAAAASAAAGGAFKYNRENYMFDNTLRFSRYLTSYGMAIAQASQYREDVRDLTAFTVTKSDIYQTLGAVGFLLTFQLVLGGRLGVNGPPPPGWLMGLYWGNVFSAFMFLVNFTWLSLHASARAAAGAAHMLTRSVRLPVPTPRQLDRARTTGNAYEKQRLSDMFRVPFVSPAPHAPPEDDLEVGACGSAAPMPSKLGSGPAAGARRAPRWYQDELRELHWDAGAATSSAGHPAQVPQHFEGYRRLQEEWWSYDVYARIGVLYFFSHWLAAISLYCMAHIFSELRLLWPAWAVVAVLVSTHYCLLTVDIVNVPREGGGLNFPVERVVPVAPAVAVLGLTCDYAPLPASATWKAVIYLLSWICYVIYFAWALRLYDLAAPQRRPQEPPEVAGKPWWPAEWQLPPAFQDAAYLVAAPRQAPPGERCLLAELRRRAAKGAGGSAAEEPPMAKRAARPPPPHNLPWKLFRGACIMSVLMWAMIMVGRAFEQVNGEGQLLRQPGLATRWPARVQPGAPPWSRHGARDEWCHAGGCDRRLLQASSAGALDVGPLPGQPRLEGQRPPPTPPAALQLPWPPGLRPTLLAAAGQTVVALNATGRGVVVRLRLPSAEPGPPPAVTAAAPTPSSASVGAFDRWGQLMEFAVAGADALGPVVAASLSEAGALLLATARGELLECRGLPPPERSDWWACPQVPAPAPSLPYSHDGAALAVAVGAVPRRAAVALAPADGEEASTVLLYDEGGDAAGAGEWELVGEVRLPVLGAEPPRLSLCPSGEGLVAALGDGSVWLWPLNGSAVGRAAVVAQPRPAATGRAAAAPQPHLAACGLRGGLVAALAPRAGGGDIVELLLHAPAAGAAAL